MAALRRAGSGLCAEPICVMKSRLITPAMPLHLSHDPSGTRYIGLAHARCGVVEAAVRARAKQGRYSGRNAKAKSATGARQSRLRW